MSESKQKVLRFPCVGCAATLASSSSEAKKVACGKCNTVQSNPLHIPKVTGVQVSPENFANLIVGKLAHPISDSTPKTKASKKPAEQALQTAEVVATPTNDAQYGTMNQVLFTGAQPSGASADIAVDTFVCVNCGQLLSLPSDGETQPKKIACMNCNTQFDNPKYKTFQELDEDDVFWLEADDDGEDPKFRRVTNFIAVFGFIGVAFAAIYPSVLLIQDPSIVGKQTNGTEADINSYLYRGNFFGVGFPDMVASITFVYFALLQLTVEVYAGVVSRRAWATSAMFVNVNWLMLILWNRVVTLSNPVECLQVSDFVNTQVNDEDVNWTTLPLSQVAIYFAEYIVFIVQWKFLFDGLFSVGVIGMNAFKESTLLMKRPVRKYTPNLFKFTEFCFVYIAYVASIVTYFVAFPTKVVTEQIILRLNPDLESHQVSPHWKLYFPIAVSTACLMMYSYLSFVFVAGCNFGINWEVSQTIILIEVGIVVGWLFMSPFVNRKIAKFLGFNPYPLAVVEELEKKQLQKGISMALIPKAALDESPNPEFDPSDY